MRIEIEHGKHANARGAGFELSNQQVLESFSYFLLIGDDLEF